jgi:hypothetical protein
MSASTQQRSPFLPKRVPISSIQATPPHQNVDESKTSALMKHNQHKAASVISTKPKIGSGTCQPTKANGQFMTTKRPRHKMVISNKEQNARQHSPMAKAAPTLPNRLPVPSIRAPSHMQVMPRCLSNEPRPRPSRMAKQMPLTQPTGGTIISNRKMSTDQCSPAVPTAQTQPIEQPRDSQELPFEHVRMDQELTSERAQSYSTSGEMEEE